MKRTSDSVICEVNTKKIFTYLLNKIASVRRDFNYKLEIVVDIKSVIISHLFLPHYRFEITVVWLVIEVM